MDNISKSVSSMMDALTPALQKLSETFCVSIDYLRANAMYYIMEYGKYCLAKHLVFGMWIVLMAEVALGLGLYFIIRSAYFSHFYYTVNMGRREAEEATGNKLKKLKLVRLFIGVSIIVLVIWAASACLPYWISPEMYSIEQVMKLMNGGI